MGSWEQQKIAIESEETTMTFPGPSRRIRVEPIETPGETPAPQREPAPEKAPAKTPERRPEKVPA